MNPLFSTDFYKVDHRRQYPQGTTKVYSNLTARSGKLSNLPTQFNDEKVVFFGLQYFIKDFLIEQWNIHFFNCDKNEIVAEYKALIETALGKDVITFEHIEALHDLGYLPLEIKALPELSEVPYKVPMLTVHNTHPDFYWLTNYIETAMSAYLWKSCTSATTARWYRKCLEHYAFETGANNSFIDFQAHDFSMRGMSNVLDAAISGAAHLQYFKGTDSIPAIEFLQKYYDATGFIGGSVPATEHSVMCMGGEQSEIDTFKRLLTEIYLSGIVSIVSDTWDFWNTCTNIVAELKEIIIQREGKLVIRPDSGDPVKIICGDDDAPKGTPEHKGAVQCLWEIFGGTQTHKGFKVLDSHIGLIYGDSITPQRTIEIMEGLMRKGFASSNVVLGIGSYTYNFVTRDTHGFAVKSTYGEINGKFKEIYKSPKTDNGIKKSAKGLINVFKDDLGNLYLCDQSNNINQGLLKTVFLNGEIINE